MRIDDCIVRVESWPLITPFRISRGAKSEASTVVVESHASGYIGRGEGCPYPRYAETVETISRTLQAFDPNSLDTSDLATMRQDLLQSLPAGSARNALDCALWDLEAKLRGMPVWRIAGLPRPVPLTTCFTLSLDTPDAMAAAAVRHKDCPLLKLKLGGDDNFDADRMNAVRRARPDARLLADANEGWLPENLPTLLVTADANGLELIEQPLPSGRDSALIDLQSSIPICADEAASPGVEIEPLAGRYQAINIKLDKTGGLTAALTAIAEAKRLNLKVMIGSMVSTSLSMAPAALLGASADWVDLDSPLLLAKDRPAAMRIENGRLSPSTSELWG